MPPPRPASRKTISWRREPRRISSRLSSAASSTAGRFPPLPRPRSRRSPMRIRSSIGICTRWRASVLTAKVRTSRSPRPMRSPDRLARQLPRGPRARTRHRGSGGPSASIESGSIGRLRPDQDGGDPSEAATGSPSRRVRAGAVPTLVDAGSDELTDRRADRVVDADGVPLPDELLQLAVVLAGKVDDDLANVRGRQVHLDVSLEALADRVRDGGRRRSSAGSP